VQFLVQIDSASITLFEIHTLDSREVPSSNLGTPIWIVRDVFEQEEDMDHSFLQILIEIFIKQVIKSLDDFSTEDF
jgi:hypothetical protein